MSQDQATGVPNANANPPTSLEIPENELENPFIYHRSLWVDKRNRLAMRYGRWRNIPWRDMGLVMKKNEAGEWTVKFPMSRQARLDSWILKWNPKTQRLDQEEQFNDELATLMGSNPVMDWDWPRNKGKARKLFQMRSVGKSESRRKYDTYYMDNLGSWVEQAYDVKYIRALGSGGYGAAGLFQVTGNGAKMDVVVKFINGASENSLSAADENHFLQARTSYRGFECALYRLQYDHRLRVQMD